MSGMIRVNLTSADPARAMMEVTSSGITVYEANREDDGIVSCFLIGRKDLKHLQKLCERRGYDIKVSGAGGIYWAAFQLLKRPILVLGIAVLCLLAVYLPTRVFFVRVEGNTSIPTRLILEKCEESGICFGASRRLVRSEKVKNALLEAIPELQWAGINTSGCVATVTVRERSDLTESEEKSAVTSIVALRDGIITQCTVTGGTGLCRVGQVVRAGDLLVSGYTDCGISIRAGRAEAEIYAQTQRELTAIIPTQWTQKARNGFGEKKYALLIGKKRINFYKSSGISGTGCDKIYSEYYITLPGGFVLPVAIVTEVWTACEESVLEISDEDAKIFLSDFAARYLPGQMVAGSILTAIETVSSEGELACLQGYYACTEMIAQVRNEEIVKPYGNDH